VGVTVSAFSSLSLDPPLILMCLDRRISNLESFLAGPVAVNVLSDSQSDLSNRFASKHDDRFAGVDHAPGENGAPVLAGCLAVIECDVHEIVPGGDHEILVGAVTRLTQVEGARPLLYFRGGYHALA
jgi:flavin reductase (DIM6/NTAB) family NADH-FMN oxidoreductase RutF